MTTPIATNPRPPITIAAMSAPVKASPEEVTGVALAVAVAVPGVAVAGDDTTPAGVIVTSVVATFVPAPGFVPLATKVLTAP